jgi:hypothetical protein
MSSARHPEAVPLLEGVSQNEVDFVIPRLGVDVPLGIDPFLLFKSRDPEFQVLHRSLLSVFEKGIEALQKGRAVDAGYLFNFPEVAEIGLGYTKEGKRGSGVGSFLSELILETLQNSPAIIDRGVRHVEELQLISVGIGPDRVSDLTANVIKSFLIEYTQKQCEIWKIPLTSGVPISHVMESRQLEWTDGYYDLPTSRHDGTPILLVPRRIVRALPWINYDEFAKTEFASFLRAKAVKANLGGSGALAKKDIVVVSRKEVERVDRYVRRKEGSAVEAQPSGIGDNAEGFKVEAESLKKRLEGITVGAARATDYQHTILEILNFLFAPELIDGKPEVRTIDGTERRDIIFTNDSDQTFWNYVRHEHSGIFLMFETKNTEEIGPAALNQTATYLGDRLGRLGFIVTRHAVDRTAQRKAFSIHNDSSPRKIVLFLTDHDLNLMLDMKSSGKEPMRHIQNLYRAFRTSVQ